ncbi:uncharacterized protein LOC117322478 [Pecten maximus]|uniref:uncharacterized protein LOC117322478 n=1 Tax=Pecten maximus TaxID=6579 RepID=UPI001458E428|nr:uncharacterized protein LOC117322478 [Pecten maximus]
MASSKSLRRAQVLVTYTCSLCDSVDNVNCYCNDCQVALCDRCKEVHTRGKKTRNDDVVSIGKASRQEDKPVPEVCKLHPGKLCDLHCADCNEMLCSICVSKTHKHHNWKHLEETLPAVKEQIKEHMGAISGKIELFKNEISKLHRANKASIDNIDTTRKHVNAQRSELIAEVNSVADAVLDELSALEKEESVAHKTDCQQYEEKVQELTLLHGKAEATKTNRSIISLLEIEKSMRTFLPRYDVNVAAVLPKQPGFVAGGVDRAMLTKMFGELHRGNHYEKIDINSQHVTRLSKFTVTQRRQIFSICPVDNHAWLSMDGYAGLLLVSREGVVVDTVNLNFNPYSIAAVGTTAILMISNPLQTVIYKMSLHNKQMTAFANTSPHNASAIGINKTGEVFVCTGARDIVVLNQFGTIVKKLAITVYGLCIVCLSFGIAVSGENGNYMYIGIAPKVFIMDESGKAILTWSGELDNGQQLTKMHLCKMSCDKYDRLFVPDFENHQVYVLPRNGTQATRLLDQKHGVVETYRDERGHVWGRMDRLC